MKRIIVLFFIATGFNLNAQTIGTSPYSNFGIGEVKYDNSVELGSMGGIGTAYVSDFNNSFNFKNPAANQNLEITSIRIQANNENSFYKSNYNTINTAKHSTYLSSVAIAFPISKAMKFGATFQPYSSKNYNIISSEHLSDGSTVTNSFRGGGTINTFGAAVGYKVNADFSLGLRTNYYFGTLSDIEEVSISNTDYVNGFETKNEVKSFNLTLGSIYQKKLKDGKKLSLGATYTLGAIGSLDTQYTNSSYFYYQGVKNDEGVIDQKKSSNKGLIPQEFSLGAGYGKDAKWFVSGQLDYKSGKTVPFTDRSFTYNNTYKLSAGGWYLPNINNFRNYLSRVIYRYGAFYEKGNLNLNDRNINQYGMSLGATFPFQKSSITRMSGLDFGVEIGKRGTTQNNLINQTFVNFKIGINFADKWFEKRYYD